jgi:hypothetical protein
MKLDNFINRLSWKKIIFVVIGVIIAMHFFCEIFFLSVFKKSYNALTHVIENEDQNMQQTKNKFEANDKKVTQSFNKAFADIDARLKNTSKQKNSLHQQEE